MLNVSYRACDAVGACANGSLPILARREAAGHLGESVLLASSLSTGVTLTLVLLWWLHARSRRREPLVFRLVSGGSLPDVELSSGNQYHLFLSHVWGSGQDQARAWGRSL